MGEQCRMNKELRQNMGGESSCRERRSSEATENQRVPANRVVGIGFNGSSRSGLDHNWVIGGVGWRLLGIALMRLG